ncbi:MAG: ABC transporter ATP-binding protein [Metamycoplasmataceae bacterium]
MKDKNIIKTFYKTGKLDIDTQLVILNKKDKKIYSYNNNHRRKFNGEELRKNEGNYIIELENVSKFFIDKIKLVKTLSNISLKIERGEFVILLGPSGSGKSTLLNILSGLDRPSMGNVIVENKNLPFLTQNELLKFRRENVSFIFQSYNLLNNLTGEENIETGAYLQKDINKKVSLEPLIKEFGLQDIIYKYPNEMSGGQQQRISILRALAKNSNIIFADEPTASLDPESSQNILSILKKINVENNKTIILVTHDMQIIKYATRIIKINDCKIVEDYKINDNKYGY